MSYQTTHTSLIARAVVLNQPVVGAVRHCEGCPGVFFRTAHQTAYTDRSFHIPIVVTVVYHIIFRTQLPDKSTDITTDINFVAVGRISDIGRVVRL